MTGSFVFESTILPAILPALPANEYNTPNKDNNSVRTIFLSIIAPKNLIEFIDIRLRLNKQIR
jgi:hypothetical protein